MTFKRLIYKDIFIRLQEPRKFIQVLIGPRQVGKTTLARQLIQELQWPAHYASADEPGLQGAVWLEQQWETARLLSKQNNSNTLLVIDEIQKIEQWSSIVKLLWDQDTASQIPLYVVLLGSSSWLLQKRLTESLAGRFEIIPVSHWQFTEMQQAFNYTLDQYIYFGGYPGASSLIGDEERWKRYLLDSLIETTLSRDIMLMTRIDKPALLRRVFQLASIYSSQILSFQKMVGQLQDAGNTTTISHYLELLSSAGLVTGLSKYAGEVVRQRASSPKLQVLNTGIATAQSPYSLVTAKQNSEYWGRLVESTVGAHLINTTLFSSVKVLYWREKNHEVDFILQYGDELIAIEVKSTAFKSVFLGLEQFDKLYKPKRILQVGGQGIPLEYFLTLSPQELFLLCGG